MHKLTKGEYVDVPSTFGADTHLLATKGYTIQTTARGLSCLSTSIELEVRHVDLIHSTQGFDHSRRQDVIELLLRDFFAPLLRQKYRSSIAHTAAVRDFNFHLLHLVPDMCNTVMQVSWSMSVGLKHRRGAHRV